ncbi:MAG: bifunctional allantoicase/(S)-ureidoglycine aminohydrolase [Pseudoruegeria sp.]
MTKYASAPGGLPAQSSLTTSRAVFTNSYAVIPADVMTDIVTSNLPFWNDTRAWIIARPMSGFAETFAQYVMETAPGGGSQHPEPDADAQAVLLVTEGDMTLTIDAAEHTLSAGGYAYIPAGAVWTVLNTGAGLLKFHWVRKRYEAVAGIDAPTAFVTRDQDHTPQPMPETEGRWATTRFVDASDMGHDMQVNIVTFQPGGVIPFPETHVMEHGLYVLEGKANYLLNKEWIEVQAGDFMWLRAFCPQACYASGPGPFRYLLYKDINRHPKLGF